MDGEKKNYTKEIITSILGVLILLVLIFGTSYAVTVSDGEDKINTLTLGYLSFNFTEDNNNVIKMDNITPVSDSVGIKNSKYYEFKVSNDYDKDINYEVLLEPIIIDIDGKYIKLYLTDENDKAVKEFENGTITFSNLSDSKLDGNKVLYNGVLKAKTKKTYRLRVWVSDSYDADLENLGISFKVDVKGTV